MLLWLSFILYVWLKEIISVLENKNRNKILLYIYHQQPSLISPPCPQNHHVHFDGRRVTVKEYRLILASFRLIDVLARLLVCDQDRCLAFSVLNLLIYQIRILIEATSKEVFAISHVWKAIQATYLSTAPRRTLYLPGAPSIHMWERWSASHLGLHTVKPVSSISCRRSIT